MADKQISAPSYGDKKKNRWSLQKGDNHYRVLPPFGNMATEGRWAYYDKVHWGYKDSNGRFRTFRCVEKKDFKTNMTTVACGECDLVEKKTKAKDQLYKDQLKAGATEEEAKEFVVPYGKWILDHNLDKKWYLNVKNTDGDVGYLKIGHKAFMALQASIATLIKKGIDPISINGGVWFNFKRVGEGLATEYYIEVETESVTFPDGTKGFRDKPALLTDADLKRMQSSAYELDGLAPDLTPEQVNRLAESGGLAAIVDAVFSVPTTTKTEASLPTGATVTTSSIRDDDEPSPEQLASLAKQQPVKTQAPTPAPVKVATQPAVDDEELQLMAQLAAIKKRKDVQTQQKVSADAKNMSDEEFLASFGGGPK